MNIFETIQRETAELRSNIAVIEGDDRITYAGLFSRVDRAARSLSAHGVGNLHRVGLLCDDSIDYIVASLAILSLRAAVVPVSPEQTGEERDTVIKRIDVDYVISEARLHQDDKGEPLASSGFVNKAFRITRRAVRERPHAEYFRMHPAFIRFSSGTTGLSKGVVLSHEAIIERTDAADQALRITPQDRILWVLSMSYHFVVTILLFLRRGAMIILCGSRFPEMLIRGITEHHGTFMYASPFHYSLLSRTDALRKEALGNIRMAVSTAMKLPGQIAEEFHAKFGLELTEAYGIIEVGLPFIKTGGGGKRGSVGKAVPGFELRLDNKDDEGVGEIRIRGKGMLDAYYSPWQSREEILEDGWFKTGDLGRIDSDGYLFIVGREKDVINFAGMKIFAQEVETVLNQHPQVRETLVYGADHPVYGQLPMAKIVSRKAGERIDLNELRRFCYQRLAQYKVPKDFSFVDALPKTASGKIKRTP